MRAEGINHELEVHKEELRGQFDQLQSTQRLLEASRDDDVTLYDFAPVPYFTLNPHCLVDAVNLTGCTLLQIEREKILGLPLTSFVEEPHRPLFLDHMRRCRTIAGEQVTTELSLRSTEGKAIPAMLMAVTGYGRDEDMKLALAAGFDRHLVKPVALSDLARMLNSV